MRHKRSGDHFTSDVQLNSLPDHALVGVINIPHSVASSPWSLITRRFGYAFLILIGVTVLVYFDRDGYTEELTWIDATYYSAITLSTTGYGDITPVTQSARLINILIITPARLAFLILLLGTTLSVLTENSRKTLQINQWRKTVRNHTVVIGYGTKGRAAVTALIADGIPANQIVVVDSDRSALMRAERRGLVTVHGNGTKRDVLKIAGTTRARSIVVASDSDDTAVLITLSVRELAPDAIIVASVRESENQHLLEQSGADSVVISSETAGRLLGLATVTPPVVEMMEDLLSPEDGFAIEERVVTDTEVGMNPRTLDNLVLGIVRDGELFRIDTEEAKETEAGDKLLLIRRS